MRDYRNHIIRPGGLATALRLAEARCGTPGHSVTVLRVLSWRGARLPTITKFRGQVFCAAAAGEGVEYDER